MKATEQYFPAVLFIMLDKVVLSFETVDEILKCNHSKLMKATELNFCGAVYYAVQDVSVESSDFVFPVMDYTCMEAPPKTVLLSGWTYTKEKEFDERKYKKGRETDCHLGGKGLFKISLTESPKRHAVLLL